MSAAGQTAPALIARSTSCPTCQVLAEKIVRLSDTSADIDGTWQNVTVVDRDSRGRYFVSDIGSRSAVMVFDSRGRFEGKIGRLGSGPGEFRHLSFVLVGKGDTLHAFDRSLARRAVVAPGQMRVLQEYPWKANSIDIIQMASGKFVTAASEMTSGGFGNPLHVVDSAGNVLKSFGATGRVFTRGTDLWLQRRLTGGSKGEFYAVPRMNYLIEQWSETGRLLHAWRPEANWFPPSEPAASTANAEKGLPPTVVTTWTDSSGYLFVASIVRQNGWERALAPMESEGRRFRGIADRNKYYDTVIDVFDLKAARLVATHTFDLAFMGRAGPGQLFVKGVEPRDFIDIWRVRLARR